MQVENEQIGNLMENFTIGIYSNWQLFTVSQILLRYSFIVLWLLLKKVDRVTKSSYLTSRGLLTSFGEIGSDVVLIWPTSNKTRSAIPDMMTLP